MKQFFSIFILMCSIAVAYGQVTLQKSYNYSTTVIKLETLGYKYYLMDVPNAQCRIYNMDHSIFKTINCTVPNNNYLADIKFVSESLFNTDSQIEILYTYYKYVSGTTPYYIYGTRIVSENGNNLLSIDGAQYNYINKTGEKEYKLFSYCFDYSVFPEKVWTNIYNLGGTFVNSSYISANKSDVLLDAFPNPATDSIQLKYVLPENVKSARLNIIDLNGKAVKNYQIDGHTDYLSLQVNDLSSGVYLYFIEYDNLRSPSKKIVIQ